MEDIPPEIAVGLLELGRDCPGLSTAVGGLPTVVKPTMFDWLCHLHVGKFPNWNAVAEDPTLNRALAYLFGFCTGMGTWLEIDIVALDVQRRKIIFDSEYRGAFSECYGDIRVAFQRFDYHVGFVTE